ncbi:TPA: vitamin B12 ABC transporter substrate-binding protein BtuF [Providencia stuartii]|uniref:vitamin B12 ABC transporter substrate-binding protein BtuF n=1 Tax=Providencia stuartii TaxID=588 RepID=UPI00113FF02D|nr:MULTISPECIES: vitamin B12 ABC transporter substrate-binding protein BtuF [Providencia]MBN5559652.1 vitamin B12 ABC transporter substrate-binding protein BtuF [Providencia stuartii]MBN5599628.1 vitamin B12 ABC transporter substrate-binding protein BtuF [Providencia stuartii]MBN5603146.1 vitamin B12 ABC transporter substrate-binding protein BtuF [Providencia stuartii]MCL8325264.1 vitamin B12 ABC transporter substrate-binding protein BtuF [Providencia thailandensis]MDF4173462.1 vitamin B12 ABC
MKWHPSTLQTTLALLLLLFFNTSVVADTKHRVISLSPANTELAYAAGLGESLIAVSAYSDYPAKAKQLEQVSDWQGLNVERIVALKPDLILAWRGGNPQRPLDQLAALGIPIIYFDPQSVEGVISAIEQLAKYSPQPQIAQQSVLSMREQLNQLKQRYAQQERPKKRVFIQLGTQPLFSTGSNTIQNDIVSMCGGENIFANSAVPWPQVSREQVIARQPEMIVMTGTETQETAVRQFWQTQLSIPIIRLNEDWFHRAGPRVVLAAQSLCEQLHSE